MNMLEKANGYFRNIGKYLSGFSILAMMFIIVLDVFMRNVLGRPLAGTYEIVQYFLMPIAIFPALGYAYWSGVLPRLSELISKMGNKFQQFHRFLILVIDLIVFSLLAYYGLLFAVSGFQESMAIPVAGKLVAVWPVYFLVPIGFLFVVLEIILRFFRQPEQGGEVGI